MCTEKILGSMATGLIVAESNLKKTDWNESKKGTKLVKIHQKVKTEMDTPRIVLQFFSFFYFVV